MIVEQHDVELEPFLNGRHDLGVHHEVGAIADHHVHLAIRRSHLHAQSARDLVAHAGIAVLQVIALGVARPPELVQVTGQAPRGAHDDVAGLRKGVDDPDDLGLGEARPTLGACQALDFLVPLALELRDLLGVLVTYAIISQGLGQLF